jgi:polyisoprenoid-binding protein YceI
MRLAILSLFAAVLLPTPCGAQEVPVFEIDQTKSTARFAVKGAVAVNGTFDKWNATMTFTSTDPTTGSVEMKIQTASVNTGSGMKDKKLKGKDFFDADEYPLATFRSTKVTEVGPESFTVIGDFTVRGVTKQETLTVTASGKGMGTGTIHGTMAFDRKDFGMTKGIPLLKIADRVEVIVDLKGKRVGGPPLIFRE